MSWNIIAIPADSRNDRGGGCAELMRGEDPTKDQSHPVTAEDPSGERDRGRIKREVNRPQHLAGAEIGNFGPGIKQVAFLRVMARVTVFLDPLSKLS